VTLLTGVFSRTCPTQRQSTAVPVIGRPNCHHISSFSSLIQR